MKSFFGERGKAAWLDQRILAALIVLAATATLVLRASAGVAPVTLPKLEFQPATLSVLGKGDKVAYDPAALETLGTYRMRTRTPWRKEPAVFDGVLLADVLRANGLEDAAAIIVTAENDYVVEIPREVWTRWPAMIATRVDGEAHRRRARGPFQIVFPLDEDPTLGDRSFEYYWVWMASRIERAR